MRHEAGIQESGILLYKLFEAQHTALAPLRFVSEMTHAWLSHPLSPWAWTPASRRLAAGQDLFLRVTQRYEKPEWGISGVEVGGQRAALSIETELAKPFCNLIRFRRHDEGQARATLPKVLLVAPLSGHHATLLRDTVVALVADHEVWVTDWVDGRLVPLSQGPFGLSTYVEYIIEFARHLAPDLSIVSVCQPTVPVLAAVSLMATRGDPSPRAMVMMGGPIDARKSPTSVNNLATRKPLSWFEHNVIARVPARYAGYNRRVYPGFLQHLGFVAMNPDRHLGAHWDYYNHLIAGDGQSAQAHRRFYDEYNAVLDLPAEYYLDTIRTVFQDFALPKGRMFVGEELVRPAAIRDTALLTIEGEKDDISGNGQTRAAHALCTGISEAKREHYEAPGVGHYGIFSGRRWREMIYPRIRSFIRDSAARQRRSVSRAHSS